ncbi:MAG: phosphotransferase [Zavarzinia sp.]|nr:phosphotransferase [Zavarzinia sp.]
MTALGGSMIADLAARLGVPDTRPVASPLRLATDWDGQRLETASGPCFVKKLRAGQGAVIDVAAVAEASALAGAIGIAPRLLAADADRGLLVFEALDEADWHWSCIDDLIDERLSPLLGAMKAFHAAGTLSVRRDIFADIAALRALAAGAGANLPHDAVWLGQCVDLIGIAMAAAGSDAVPVRADGAASNVLRGRDGGVLLVDFDRAGMGDPWLDVAVVLNELFQFEEEWQAALELWAGRCHHAEYARVRLYAMADDMYWGLWGLWNAALHRGQGIEFFKYGQWRLLRLRQSLSDARFETWLRRV